MRTHTFNASHNSTYALRPIATDVDARTSQTWKRQQKMHIANSNATVVNAEWWRWCGSDVDIDDNDNAIMACRWISHMFFFLCLTPFQCEVFRFFQFDFFFCPYFGSAKICVWNDSNVANDQFDADRRRKNQDRRKQSEVFIFDCNGAVCPNGAHNNRRHCSPGCDIKIVICIFRQFSFPFICVTLTGYISIWISIRCDAHTKLDIRLFMIRSLVFFFFLFFLHFCCSNSTVTLLFRVDFGFRFEIEIEREKKTHSSPSIAYYMIFLYSPRARFYYIFIISLCCFRSLK